MIDLRLTGDYRLPQKSSIDVGQSQEPTSALEPTVVGKQCGSQSEEGPLNQLDGMRFVLYQAITFP
jgi:hypothetical protein